MIKFDSITFKNFLQSGNQKIKYNFGDAKSTLISGTNGAGKSILLDALMFGLYGIPYRAGISKNQLINYYNKKQTEVEINITINSKKYKIVRTLKPSSLMIYENSKLIEQKNSLANYQKFFEQKILRTSPKTARQLLALGTAGYIPFMQLTAADRRHVIEDVLDIGIFSRMNEENKNALKTLKDDLKVLEHEYQLIERERSVVSNVINSETTQNNKEKIDSIKTKIEKLNKLSFKLDMKIDELGLELNDLQAPGLIDKKSKIQEEITKFKYKIENSENKINFVKKNDTCPTCKQEILSKDEIIKESESIKSMCTAKANKLQTGLEKINDKLMAIEEKQNEIRDVKNSHNTALASLNSCNELLTEMENSKSTCIYSSDDLKELDLKLNKISEKIEDINSKLYCREIVGTLLKDTGIKSKIILSYLNSINLIFNEYLEKLGLPFVIEFDSEFKENIRNKHAENTNYFSFSEGQKMRINLALLFTWREISMKRIKNGFDLLILDEVMDGSLNGEGIDSLLKVLKSLDENFIIITHNMKFEGVGFDKKVTVKKKGKFTKLEVSKNV